VAEDATVGHFGYVAFEDVKIRSADGGGVDLHNGIGVVNDDRLGHLLPRFPARAAIDDCVQW
jgi:hypothetical protein